MDVFIQEEYIIEAFVIIVFGCVFLAGFIFELIDRRKEIDEFSRFKMKKIFKYVYFNLFDRDKEETIKYMREIKNKNLINEKYDLIKGA